MQLKLDALGADLRAKIAAWNDHPEKDRGRLLYGLNYNGAVHLYDLAPPEIQARYDDLAALLTTDLLYSAALVLKSQRWSILNDVKSAFIALTRTISLRTFRENGIGYGSKSNNNLRVED